INTDWAVYALDKPLDLDRVIKIALVHDLAESILTDLPKRSAALLGSDVKHAAEARALAQLFTDLPNSDLYRLLWAEYDNNSSPEARLVRDADKLEMVHQALCYERRGHHNLEEFWQEHTWQYEASKLLFEHLYQNRR
ncbi:MAG: HD domain-containing protein, partial [Chloroflexi bacterium]|nr:HD domain-containing protein [Chloroflexota bacterium]